MRLKELCSIRVEDPDADFWIERRGSRDKVGKPSREYLPHGYGITVKRTDLVNPQYLFYLFEYLWSQKFFAGLARGSLNLVNIRINDFDELEFKTA